MEEVGFRQYSPPCLYLGVQSGVAVVLSAFRTVQGYKEGLVNASHRSSKEEHDIREHISPYASGSSHHISTLL